jgi:mannose-6-phosphate isomerase-like protein (cupin superfamily)
MNEKKRYSIHTDIRFNALELIDIPQIVSDCDEEWFNQTLCRVNDCVVRLGIIRGEFHWHKHDDEDEFFYVINGRLHIDLEDRTVELSPNQAFVVPKGVQHRTRAPEGVVILMIEGSGVTPTGD